MTLGHRFRALPPPYDLAFGTSSWSYPRWHGVGYGRAARSIELLAEAVAAVTPS